jgi:hypothetical protein
MPDGLVQLIDGLIDLASRAVIAHQGQRGVEVQARGEQPTDYDVVQAQGNPLAVPGQVPADLCLACGGTTSRVRSPRPAMVRPMMLVSIELNQATWTLRPPTVSKLGEHPGKLGRGVMGARPPPPI